MTRQSISALVVLALFTLVSPAHAIFIGDNRGALWDLNVTDNTSTNLGNSGVGAMFDIALNSTTNTLYGVTNSQNLFSIDQSNGKATRIGSTGAFINGLTFNQGTLFGAGNYNLYTINTSTGASTTLYEGNEFNSSGDIAFTDDDSLWLTATRGNGGDQLVLFEKIGNRWSVSGISHDIGYDGVYGLNYDAISSSLYGFTQGGQTLKFDGLTSGLFTVTEDNTNGIAAYGADGVSSAAPVPEPSTMLLFGCGLVGLAGIDRRKKK